jgi:alpha-N-arabinofuranosidase
LDAEPPAKGNLLANPGFEDAVGGLPAGWNLNEKLKAKGAGSVVESGAHTGQRALRLQPTDRNTDDILAFNLGQGFPVDPIRGKTLRVSAWMAAEGSATGILGAYTVDKQGAIIAQVSLTKTSAPPGFASEEGMLEIPADPRAFLLVVTCAVRGTSGAALFDDVVVEPVDKNLPAGTARSAAEAGAVTGALEATVLVNAKRRLRSIPRTLYGQNIEWPNGGSMVWDFRTKALNPDIIRLARELGTTLLRFPGGSFADFYHWRDGVGPQDARPAREPMLGHTKSPNFFGTDEAREFADSVGAELMFIVNAHTGTPQEAADWVRYVSTSGKGGARVPFWEIGNEFYIKNDDPSNAAIPPEEYVRRFKEFVPAMKQADPSIRILAIGAENFGLYTSSAFPGWNRTVLEQAGSEMDYLALHNAYQPTVFDDGGADVRTVYAAMLASPILIKKNLDVVSKQIATYGGSRAAQIKIAITEWSPIFHIDVKNRWVDHVNTLGSGLFVASTMKAFLESPRVEIANAFKLAEPGFMGWIQARYEDILTRQPQEGQFAPTAPYYALQMYTRHFGETLVESSSTSPTYDSIAVGMADRVSDVPYLDVVSSLSGDGKTLYLLAINKHFDEPIRAKIALDGFKPDGGGSVWTLNGTGIDANTGTRLPRGPEYGRPIEAQPNPRFSKGGPGEVTLSSQPLQGASAAFEFTFPAHSVTSLEIRGAPTGAP